jgi:MFS family permease
MSKLRELPRNLLYMTFAAIIANVASNMYTPLLPLYLESLGANVQQVGFFFTIQVILAICFRILGGWISDNMGRLQTIAGGALFGTVGFCLLAIAPTWEWIIVAALFGQMGISLVSPSYQAYIAENAPEGGMGSTFGFIESLFAICMIVGPLLGGFLVDQAGFKTMMWVAAVIYAGAAGIRIWMARRFGEQVRRETTLKFNDLWNDMRGMIVLIISGGVLFWLFIADGFLDASVQMGLPFMPKYMTDVGGVSETGYGALFAFASVIGIGALAVSGLLSDRFGERRVLMAGALLAAAVWFALASTSSVSGFILVFGLTGVAQALIGPAFSALVSKSAPKESLGMTWGLFQTALGFLAIPAPVIGGWLYKNASPTAPFIAAGVCALLTIPVILRKVRVPSASAAVETALIKPVPEPAEP